MTTIDIISVGIFIFYALLGYWKGAIRTLVDMVGLIASFFLALVLAPALAQWVLEDSSWSLHIYRTLADLVAQVLLSGQGRGLVSVFLPAEVFQLLQADPHMGQVALAGALEAHMSPLAVLVVQMVVFAGTFILFAVLMTFFRRLAKRANDLPFIGFVNRTLGMVLGGLKGMVLVLIGLVFLYLGAFVGQNLSMIALLEEGLLTGPLLWILFQLIK